jgi:hypothetical protein
MNYEEMAVDFCSCAAAIIFGGLYSSLKKEGVRDEQIKRAVQSRDRMTYLLRVKKN